jgi:hypothetical protein
VGRCPTGCRGFGRSRRSVGTSGQSRPGPEEPRGEVAWDGPLLVGTNQLEWTIKEDGTVDVVVVTPGGSRGGVAKISVKDGMLFYESGTSSGSVTVHEEGGRRVLKYDADEAGQHARRSRIGLRSIGWTFAVASEHSRSAATEVLMRRIGLATLTWWLVVCAMSTARGSRRLGPRRTMGAPHPRGSASALPGPPGHRKRHGVHVAYAPARLPGNRHG